MINGPKVILDSVQGPGAGGPRQYDEIGDV